VFPAPFFIVFLSQLSTLDMVTERFLQLLFFYHMTACPYQPVGQFLVIFSNLQIFEFIMAFMLVDDPFFFMDHRVPVPKTPTGQTHHL